MYIYYLSFVFWLCFTRLTSLKSNQMGHFTTGLGFCYCLLLVAVYPHLLIIGKAEANTQDQCPSALRMAH